MTRRTEGRLIKARLPLWRRLGWRLGASFLLVSAVGIFLAGHLQYRSEERVLRRAIGLVLLNVARTGAILIDGELHESVVKDGSKDTVDLYAQAANPGGPVAGCPGLDGRGVL